MTKYNAFLAVFIISIIAMILFFVFYLQAIFGFVAYTHDLERMHPNPFDIFGRIFTPAVIISGVVLAFTSLAYRIMGIVHVAKSKTAGDGEKALWIVGFIIMGFVTGIVFLVMAKGRKFV